MRSLLVLCAVVASTCAYSKILPKTILDPSSNWRIIGGSDAPDGAYPHMISLRYFGSHACGGSIVNEEWVITAAHCVYSYGAWIFKIVVGSNKLDTGGTSYRVLKIYTHPKYQPGRLFNDVAVLKVKKIKWTDKVQKIAVEENYVPADVDVILSGWGLTSYDRSAPNDLQHIPLRTTTVEQCREAHAEEMPVIDTQICTFTKEGEGACMGDSGGPLMIENDGVPKLVGIVSWSQPCAVGYPDVFTRVSSFVSWLNETCNCL